MTIGELVKELQKLNQNLTVGALSVVRDEDGEHVSLTLETTARKEPARAATATAESDRK